MFLRFFFYIFLILWYVLKFTKLHSFKTGFEINFNCFIIPKINVLLYVNTASKNTNYLGMLSEVEIEALVLVIHYVVV